MIDFNYTAPELLPFRIQEVLDAPNEPHRIGGVVYVPEGGGECEMLPQLSDTVCVVKRKGFEMQFGYWRCSKCGCENFEGAKYCMNCGRKAVKR